MSEEEQQQTAAQPEGILLPASRIEVFSRDQDTINSAEALKADWRFARVQISAQQGGVEDAIASYQENASPDLVIVQSDNLDDSFKNSLEALAGNCDEGTAAIVIGPVNDVYLYRQMIDMGVSDYLVKPLNPEMLAGVLSKTLTDRLGVSGSKLIALVGAKGGVGTSLISQTMAWGVADLLGHKTMLLDLAGGWSSYGVGLGFEPATTLLEATRAAEKGDEESLARMLHQASEKLEVLAHGGDVMLEQPLTGAQIEKLIDTLMVKYPVVVCDLSHSPVPFKKVVLNRAQQIYMISNASLSSLRLARSLIQEIKETRGGNIENLELLINMLGWAPGIEVPKADIQQAMDYEPSGFIPYDLKQFLQHESEALGVLEDDKGKAIFNEAILPLLKKILSVDEKALEDADKGSGGFLGGLLGGGKKKAG